MHPPSSVTPRPPGILTAYHRHGDAMRSRSVGARVLADRVEIPALPARLMSDWHRDSSMHLGLAPGDVEPMSLPRARMRWPAYRQCVQAVADWMGTLGLPDLTAGSEIALMACRGARYHHDGALYGGAAFCNLFLSEDRALDVHFPGTGQRIALARGTVLIFDTGQPHAVIPRGRDGFDAADFGDARDAAQVFLTWELPINQAALARLLGIVFDTDPATASGLDEEQVRVDGARAELCPASGRWRAPG